MRSGGIARAHIEWSRHARSPRARDSVKWLRRFSNRPWPLQRFLRGIVTAGAIAVAAACQDHDPLSPLVPQRRLTGKLNRTLSGSLAVGNPADINTSGEVVGIIPVGSVSHAAIGLNGSAYDLGTIDQSSGTRNYPTG